MQFLGIITLDLKWVGTNAPVKSLTKAKWGRFEIK